MCVIVSLNGGQTITKEYFDKMYERNSDGIGFMFVPNNQSKVRIHKGMWKVDKAYRQFLAIRDWTNGHSLVVHFRKISRGVINIHNVHPFDISETCGMAHNGTIDIPMLYKDRSDTWHFVEYLKQIIKNSGRPIEYWLENKTYFDAIENNIGYRNKLAFLTTSNNGTVYTMGKWETHEGIKYSNLLWLKSADYSDIGYYTGSSSSSAYSNYQANSVSYVSPPKVLYVSTWGDSKFEWGVRELLSDEKKTYYYVKLVGGNWPSDPVIRRLCYNSFVDDKINDKYEPFALNTVYGLGRNDGKDVKGVRVELATGLNTPTHQQEISCCC